MASLITLIISRSFETCSYSFLPIRFTFVVWAIIPWEGGASSVVLSVSEATIQADFIE